MLIRLAIRLLGVYFVAAGALLAVGPWTMWWEQNLFVSLVPDLSLWMTNDIVRAAVSAVGGLTLLTGVWDLRGPRTRARRPDAAPAAAPRDS